MRVPAILATLLAAAAGGVGSTPASAHDYSGFSGRGYNPAFFYGVPPQPRIGYAIASGLGFPVDEVPLGTAARPVPVYPPAVLFRVYRSPVYNAPPSADDLYRIVPLR